MWKAKGRAMDTNTGESPGYQSQPLYPRNSPSEEVRGHWAPMGAEPMEQWMDGWNLCSTFSRYPPGSSSSGIIVVYIVMLPLVSYITSQTL